MSTGEKRERGKRALERLKAADSQPGLLKAAATARKVLPGDEELGKGGRRASLAREAGLTALQVWQSVSEAQGRGRGEVDVTILFTDLVDFSDWALDVGDTAAISLVEGVDDVCQDAVADNRGEVVKTLGDGMMAVFADAGDGVRAARAAVDGVAALEHEGYRPSLRAGLHLGRPRKVRRDYLGVDVNVAARVAEAASAGEVLVSDAVLAELGDDVDAKRKRRFKAKGAPREMEVYELRGA